MKVELHQTPKVDKWLKRAAIMVAFLASMGAATATLKSCAKDIDESWATHAEVRIIDNASMYQHLEEQKVIPYAKSSDISHVVNVMLDEQIDDATMEVEKIKMLETRGVATPEDLMDKERFEKAIIKSKTKIEPDGHKHGEG